MTDNSSGLTQSYAVIGPASLNVLGNWYCSTGTNALFSSQSSASFSLFIKFNAPFGSSANTKIVGIGGATMLRSGATNALSSVLQDSTGGNAIQLTPGFTFTPGIVYHFAFSWAPGAQAYYINGTAVQTYSDSNPTNSGSATLGIGWPSSQTANFDIADVAIWNGYALTHNDVLGLRDGTITPLQVNSGANPATTWLPLYGTAGNAPTLSDLGFLDQGSGGNPVTTFSSTPTTSLAAYSGPLNYVASVTPTVYVSKSGQLAMFFCQQTTAFLPYVAGTVSVNKGSTNLTSSSPQVGWAGLQIQIAGDSSSGTYTITGGYGYSWTISPSYGGSSNAVNATPTVSVPSPVSGIKSVTAAPTISVQFGGVGVPRTISIDGPYWGTATSAHLPFFAYQLLCGPIDSIIVQRPGANYSTSPSASASGGGGSGLTLGAPLVSGGVTSYTVSAGGSGYSSTNPPAITITPSLPITGTLTSGATSVTGISSTVGLIPGMQVLGTGLNTPNQIAAIVSGTAITLTLPATNNGSTALTVVGKTAMGFATVSGGAITGVTVFVPGSGFGIGTTPTATVNTNGQGGTGASVKGVVSYAIASVPVTNAGTGYTSPPTITISDTTGSGAVAVPLMGGVQPSDVVTYSALQDDWFTSAAGSVSAILSGTVANYSGQLEPSIGSIYAASLAADQRTLQAGMNVANQPSYATPYSISGNWLNRAQPLPGVSGIVTTAPDGRPLTMTATAGSPTSFRIAWTAGNGIDNNGFPVPIGTGIGGSYWTFVADELNPTNPMLVSLTAFNSVVSPTGGNPTSPGTATVGVNALTLGSAGSGYTDVPTVVFTDPVGTGAAGYAEINANGQVAAVILTACGSGYSLVTPPTVAFVGGGGSGATATATTGNVLVGRTWQFSVQRTGTALNLGISINFWKTVGGTYNYTLVNECLFAPGVGAEAYPSLPDRTQPQPLDPAPATWLTTPTARYSAVNRYMACVVGTRCASNVVDPCDIKNPESYSWFGGNALSSAQLTANPTGERVITVTAIRTYALSTSGYPAGWSVSWSSPNVYLSNPGTGGSTIVSANPSWAGFGDSFDGGPYYTTPPSVAWLALQGAAWWVAECVTSAPHNLKSGQTIYWASGNSTFSVSDGAGGTESWTIGGLSAGANLTNGQLQIYVTGATTFVFLAQSSKPMVPPGGTLPGSVNNVAGTFSTNYTFTTRIPDWLTVPVEVISQQAGSLPGCDMWINMPMPITDAGAAAWMARIRDHFPPGRKVYVEYTNEHFNTVFQGWLYCTAMGQLGVWGPTATNNPDYAYAERASQLHQVAVDTFNATDADGRSGRGGEIVRLFGSFFVSPSVTSNMVTWVNSQGGRVKMDAVCVAPYIDIASDSRSPIAAASVTVGGSGGSLSAGTYYVYYTWVDALSGIESDVGASRASFTIASSGQVPKVTLPSFPSWGTGTTNIYLTAANGASGTETLYATGITSTTVNLTSGTWVSGSTSPPAYNLMPSPITAAALLATHWPTSIKYGASNPWSRAAYLDYWRHALTYDGNNYPAGNNGGTDGSGFNGNFAGHVQQLANCRYSTGPMPALVGYEGGNELLIPANIETGPDPTGNYLRGQLTIDLNYDPAIYDSELAFYSLCQQGGMSAISYFHLCGGLGSATGADGPNSYIWPLTLWESQPFGKGDGSTASNGQAITNLFWSDTQMSQHGTNASVRLQAWNDWASTANRFVAPTNVYILPANGLTGVSPRTVIVIQFNEPMLGSTFTSTTFTLKLGANSVNAGVAYDSATWTATLTPSASLLGNATYTVQVTTGVENAQGVALASPITWSFTTRAVAGTGSTSRPWFPALSRRFSTGY